MVKIIQLVASWEARTHCTTCELQSLLGHLLCVHKCVKPARFFVNRMLELLRSNYDQAKIKVTHEFKKDFTWFTKFLSTYNVVSIYYHVLVSETIELDV